MNFDFRLCEGASHRLGNFVVRESVIETKDEHRAPFFGECLQRGVDDAERLTPQKITFGGTGCWCIGVDAHHDMARLTKSCLAELERHVARDSEKPWHHACAFVEAIDVAMRAHERFLRGICRERAITEKIAQEPMNPRAVLGVEGRDPTVLVFAREGVGHAVPFRACSGEMRNVEKRIAQRRHVFLWWEPGKSYSETTGRGSAHATDAVFPR